MKKLTLVFTHTLTYKWDLLVREIRLKNNSPLFYIDKNGKVEKRIIVD